jgi:CheY-like chemotaxis protein
MKPCRIVFVDDDPDDREIIASCLHKYSFELFRTFESGEDLLRFLQLLRIDELPDVIVLDLNMPRISGHELLGMLKGDEKYKHIPVFVLSTNARSISAQDVLKEGAAGYYKKPNTYQDYETILIELYSVAAA